MVGQIFAPQILLAASLAAAAAAFRPLSAPPPPRTPFFLRSHAPAGDGAAVFERWSSASGIQSVATHASFPGELRGLSVPAGTVGRAAVTLPRSLCLDDGGPPPPASFCTAPAWAAASWDVRLALQLLYQCSLGTASDRYGYCALLAGPEALPLDLTAGGAVPPSAAPDALRNWKDGDPAASELAASPAGREILAARTAQTDAWANAHAALQTCVPYGQFAWAMEAVNSRAFRGDFGAAGVDGKAVSLPVVVAQACVAAAGVVAIFFATLGLKEQIAAACALVAVSPSALKVVGVDVGGAPPVVVAQAAAAAAGIGAILYAPLDLKEPLAAVCALAVAAPLVAQVLAGDGGGTRIASVMLPWIDSANHRSGADSKIEYDPVGDVFTLDAGGGCFVDAGDGRTQL